MTKSIITIYKLLYYLTSICLPIIRELNNKIFVRFFDSQLQLFGVKLGKYEVLVINNNCINRTNIVVTKSIFDDSLIFGILENIMKINILRIIHEK